MARRSTCWTSTGARRFDQVSEEVRLNYSSNLLNLIAGVYYGADETVTDNTFNIGSVLGPGVNGGFFQRTSIRRGSPMRSSLRAISI